MQAAQSIFFIFGAICAGLALGWTLHRTTTVVHFVGRTTHIAVFCLLFLLGASLGDNTELFAIFVRPWVA